MKAGFEPSFVALALFPQVVTTMADAAWTGRPQLGQAFDADRTAVFASIQRLRSQAQRCRDAEDHAAAGSRDARRRRAAQEVIVIEPANPQVVYVPQYNPQVVYTQPTTSTVVVQEEQQPTMPSRRG